MRMLAWPKQKLGAWGGVVLLGIAMTVVSGLPAQAGLEFCNQTAEKQWVAIGYDTDDGWISEGWWGVETDECITPMPDDLNRRYYYYRLFETGFVGDGYTFCIKPEVYRTKIDRRCEKYGFEAADFAEIDTGPDALSYTFTFAAPISQGKKFSPKSGGLKK